MTSPGIEFSGISKVYPATKALNNVSFSVAAGSVRGLLGEAGSGKSTLIGILGGLTQPTHGAMSVAGKPVRFRGPADAIRAGVGVIHQECQVFPSMTVSENLFLGWHPGSSWIVDSKADEKRAVEVLERVGMQVLPTSSADRLTLGQQKMLQVCKTLVQDTPTLVFDEPTHSLSASQAEKLFDVIGELANEGRTIILVTRHMEEVFRICDSATILRHGKHVETLDTLEDVTSEDILSRMLGRDIADMYKARLQRIMRGVIHNVGNSATVSNLAQHQTHERLEKECLPLMDFIKGELMPSLKEVAGPEGGEVQERAEALENVLDHLETGLREAVSSMRTVDDRLKHIGDIVEIQQHYVDEIGTEDVIRLKRVIDEVIAMTSTDRLIVQWAVPEDVSVLVDRTMFTQLCASLTAELLRATEAGLELVISEDASNLVLTLQSAEPVDKDDSEDLTSIIRDAKLFFDRYKGSIEMEYSPNALLRIKLPGA